MVAEQPRSRSAGADLFRIAHRTAWTAQRRPLGAEPQPLFVGEESVVVLRLPEGWPFILQGPPAFVWQDLASAGELGRSVQDLAEPWTAPGAERPEVTSDIQAMLSHWESEGLVERLAPE